MKINDVDLSIPQHFTKEQSAWIKAYCIQRNKEFYNQAIDDFVNETKRVYFDNKTVIRCNELIAEQLKGEKNDD